MSLDPGAADPAAPPPRARAVNLSDLGPRFVSGLVLVMIATWTAVVGGLPFAILWWVAALAIHWEWQRLIGSGRDPARLVAGGLAIALAAVAAPYGSGGWSLFLLAAGAVVTAWAGSRRRSLSGLGVLYAGILPLSLGVLRGSETLGLAAVVWLFAVVWGTDIAAYFAGRMIGGPKLWPRVSPSKTWSGFLVGVGAGALAGFAVSLGWGGASPMLLPLGVLAGTVAQAGDLFESTLKRRFGFKDSSGLIPGHGGVMDRLDGFLAASVFAAALGAFRFGASAAAGGLLRW